MSEVQRGHKHTASAAPSCACSPCSWARLPRSRSCSSCPHRRRRRRIVYRVSPSGSDNADGIKKPFKTVQKATDTAPAGAYIELAPGTYAPFTVKRKGQTIIGKNAEKVVIKGRLRDAGQHPDRCPQRHRGQPDGQEVRPQPRPGRRVRRRWQQRHPHRRRRQQGDRQGRDHPQEHGEEPRRAEVRVLRHPDPRRERLQDPPQRHRGHRQRDLLLRRRQGREGRAEQRARQHRPDPEHAGRRRRLRSHRHHLRERAGQAGTHRHQEHDHRQRRAVRRLLVRRWGVRGLQLVEREDGEEQDQQQREHAGDGHDPGRRRRG